MLKNMYAIFLFLFYFSPIWSASTPHSCRQILIQSKSLPPLYDNTQMVITSKDKRFRKKIISDIMSLRQKVIEWSEQDMPVIWIVGSYDLVHKAHIEFINNSIETFLVEHKLNRKDIKVVVSADSDLILNRSKIHKWDLKGIDGEQIPRPIQSKQFYHMETATHLSPRLLDLARSNADYVFHLPDPVHLLTQYGHNKSWIDLLKSRKSLWESKLQILIAEKKISNDSLTKFKVTLSAANKMIKALEENRSHDIISSFIKSDRVNKEDIIENWYLGGWHLLLGALITAGLPETTNIYRPLSRRDSDYIDLFSIDPYVNGMTIYHAQSKETISTTELIKNFPFMELVRKKVSYYNNN